MIEHGVLIASPHRAAWRGVLLLGPSGSGKSDLALRLLDEGFSLVADDRVQLWNSGGRLFGRAPEPIAGLIEVRGLGIRAATALPFAPVMLIARLGPREEVERMPEAEFEERLGSRLPVIHLAGLEPSTPAKLRRALNGLG